MEEVIGKFLGEIVGKSMVKKYGSSLEGLKNAIDYLFSWEKDFKLEVEDNSILSSGLCPIKRFYPKYCERGCVAFIEKFAEHFKAKVERTSTEPCTFRFTLKE